MTQSTVSAAPSAAKAVPVALLNHPSRAITYMLSQAFLLTVMDALVKWLASDYTVGQIAFLRYSIGLGITLGMALGSPIGFRSLKTKRLGGHLIRSCCNLFTMLCFYVALKLIPLPNAVCITGSSPIFVTIFSIPMLKEKVGIRRWTAVCIGFIGIVMIMKPTSAGVDLGSLLALLSGCAWALTQVSSRQLSTSESSHTILFYYSLVVVVALGVAMPFYWITPSWHDAALFLAVGIMGTAGQFCLNQAFRYGQASQIAPLDYTGLVWATILGAAVWGNRPTLLMICGAAIVVGSCLYIMRRGANKKAEQTT
ncbi:MAG TPA: DMT family transporter [Dongiaceae bacterium]